VWTGIQLRCSTEGRDLSDNSPPPGWLLRIGHMMVFFVFAFNAWRILMYHPLTVQVSQFSGTRKGPILFKIFSVFIICRGSDAPQFSWSQCGFRILDASREPPETAPSNNANEFHDKENYLFLLWSSQLHVHTLFKIARNLVRNDRTHIKGVNFWFFQTFRTFPSAMSWQAFGDCVFRRRARQRGGIIFERRHSTGLSAKNILCDNGSISCLA